MNDRVWVTSSALIVLVLLSPMFLAAQAPSPSATTAAHPAKTTT